jgi:hypothetical protein
MFVSAFAQDTVQIDGLSLKVIVKKNKVSIYKDVGAKGMVVQKAPLFKFYYVLSQDGKNTQDQSYYVSKSPSKADALGYLKETDVQEWRHRELVRFAPSSGRDLASVFSDRTYEGKEQTGRHCLEVALRDNKSDPSKECQANFKEPTQSDELRTKMILPILEMERVKISPTNRPQAYRVAFLTKDGNGAPTQAQSDLEEKMKVLPDLHKQVDILFVLDTTSSMQPAIDATIEVIKEASSNIFTSFEKGMIQLGIVAYRDRINDQAQMEYISKIIQPLTDDIDQFLTRLSQTKAANVGSEDHPEAMFDGISKAISDEILWRDHGNKVIFLIGDAPSHEEGPKNPNNYSADTLARLAFDKQVYVGAMQILGDPRVPLEMNDNHKKQLTILVNKTTKSLDSGSRIEVMQTKDPKMDKSSFISVATSFINTVLDHGTALHKLALTCMKDKTQCQICKENPSSCSFFKTASNSATASPVATSKNLKPELAKFLLERLDVAGLTVKIPASGFSTGWISNKGFDGKNTLIPHVLVSKRELNALIAMLYRLSSIDTSSAKDIEEVMKETLEVLTGDSTWEKGESLEDYLRRAGGLPIRSKLLRFTADDVRGWTEKYIAELIEEVNSKRKTLQDWTDNPTNWVKMANHHEITYIPMGIMP